MEIWYKKFCIKTNYYKNNNVTTIFFNYGTLECKFIINSHLNLCDLHFYTYTSNKVDNIKADSYNNIWNKNMLEESNIIHKINELNFVSPLIKLYVIEAWKYMIKNFHEVYSKNLGI